MLRQIYYEIFCLKMLFYLHDVLVVAAIVVRPAHLVYASLAGPQIFFFAHLMKDVHHGFLQLVLSGRHP